MWWETLTFVLIQVFFGGGFAAGEKKKPVKPATGTPSPKLNGQFLPSALCFLSARLSPPHEAPPSSYLHCPLNVPGVERVPFRPLVPDDVFAPNYIWKGSYNYRGRKQPMTLSITSFNSTTGRVNVSLSNGNMELLLSGMFGGQSQQSVYTSRMDLLAAALPVTRPGSSSF